MSTAIARFLNTILLALIVVFVRKRALFLARLSGAVTPVGGASRAAVAGGGSRKLSRPMEWHIMVCQKFCKSSAYRSSLDAA
ncbi:hypothetical protein D3C81_1665040 [compost metagenome]